ncbi:MAG TPA: helix-turn-helix domain-containing protein [Allosphingosinicella sp.]|nr:helix-turn-helix domain-containing protein [Allosphingosinicella sp.]
MARNPDTFADRLAAACDHHPKAPADYGRQAWIRRELARLGSDVSATAVTNWFNGYTRASPPLMAKLAQVLGVDANWLGAAEGASGEGVQASITTFKADTFDFPVPLRPGVVVNVRGVPLDISEIEARKLANVLLALGQAQE